MPPLRNEASQSPALHSASFSTVPQIIPSLSITKRRFKQVESICLIREQRASGRQELAFNARPFVLCGLPLRRPPATQVLHRRRNGRFFLHIVAHPDFGLPFGQDRLIAIWVATLALRQKSRELHFDSAAQMLDFFHLPKDGPHYRRLVDGFKRLFGATIFFGTDDQTQSAPVIDWTRFHFFDGIKLWFNRSESENASADRHDNAITISEAFYREIDDHRIPVEREVVAALAHAPGVLDFYVWLVWKSWTVNRAPAHVPLFSDSGLKAQLGTRDYTTEKRFTQTVISWIRRIKVLWPECPAEVSADGCRLVVRPCRASPTIKSSPSKL
ncbi:MAG: replication protein RepA [Terriglobia bacterium]